MALALSAGTAIADSWTLNNALSNVAFGSIKNDYVGEVHSFGALSGDVDDTGAVTLSIALGSVETLIDIRNERMIEHVFQNVPNATVTAEIDMATLDGLEVGQATTLETTGTLSLLSNEVALDTSLFVMRLSADRVLVTTDGMVMLATDDAGIDPAIDILQQIAGLDSITRVSPITLRLVFDAD